MRYAYLQEQLERSQDIAGKASETLEMTCTAAQREAAVRALRAARDLFCATIDAVVDDAAKQAARVAHALQSIENTMSDETSHPVTPAQRSAVAEAWRDIQAAVSPSVREIGNDVGDSPGADADGPLEQVGHVVIIQITARVREQGEDRGSGSQHDALSQ